MLRGSSLVATEGEVGSQEDHEFPPSQAHPQCHLLPGALKKLKDKVLVCGPQNKL